MEISMRYGPGCLTLRAPDRNVAGVVRPSIGRSRDPVHPDGLDEFHSRVHGRRALLLVPDGTRRLPAGVLSDAISAMAPAESLSVVVATGSHRAETPANRQVVTEITDLARVHHAPTPAVRVHDCRHETLSPAGVTSRGNPIRLSTCLEDPELVLVASDVKHHYFAGYSNPLKFFLPGVADFETIEANHRLTLEAGAAAGRHPLHPEPQRRANPLAEEMLEAFRYAWGDRDAFALVTVTAGGRVAHRELGELEAVTSRAFVAADEVAGVCVPPSRYVVISAGGAPMDATLYLCQRAVELSKPAIADGAEVLLLAECGDGIADSDTARRNFYDELTRPLDEILERIRTGYRLYQHKAYRFAELLQRIEALHLASSLPDNEVRAVHFLPAASAQSVLDGWVARDRDCRIHFLDEANRLAVIAEAA